MPNMPKLAMLAIQENSIICEKENEMKASDCSKCTTLRTINSFEFPFMAPFILKFSYNAFKYLTVILSSALIFSQIKCRTKKDQSYAKQINKITLHSSIYQDIPIMDVLREKTPLSRRILENF